MRKLCLILSLVLAVAMLSGCEIDLLETDNPPTLPKLELDRSSITGTVEYVNGYTLRIVVTEGDSHFDGPYVNLKGVDVPGDTIQITYSSLAEGKNVSVGDSITISYRYTKDVSEKNGIPHITVNLITVNKPAA